MHIWTRTIHLQNGHLQSTTVTIMKKNITKLGFVVPGGSHSISFPILSFTSKHTEEEKWVCVCGGSSLPVEEL